MSDIDTTNFPDNNFNYTQLKDNELSEQCGVDAKKWAEAFCQYVKLLYNVELDEGWVIGWFANPMMAMHDHCLGIKPVVLDDGSSFFVATVGNNTDNVGIAVKAAPQQI